MKKWSLILVFLLVLVCLAGCGKQEVIPGRPHALEVTYGEKSIHAITGGYAWNWKEGGKVKTVTADALDPRTFEMNVPCFCTGASGTLALDFAILPDSLTVELFSAKDSYTAGTYTELSELTMPAPLDGEDHLYTVTAQWDEDSRGWGSCTYYFRFLAQTELSEAPLMEDSGDLDLPKALSLDASGFMGIEFANFAENTVKTCLSKKDKAAIVDFLDAELPAELTPSEKPMTQTMYTMRLVALDGGQLTISFGTDGSNACMQAGGVVYQLGPMDMTALWQQLNAGSVSAAAAASGKGYQDVSTTFPMADWLSEPIFAYITDLSNGSVTYDEMRQFESQDSPTGYRYERGWSNLSKSAAADCQYWLLDDDGTYGKVSADALAQWIEHTEDDVLFCIYTSGDAITAICPKG